MEELTIINTNLKQVGVVDSFTSLLWIERFNGFGEFEFYAPYDLTTYSLMSPNQYIKLNDSKKAMIIEARNVEFDKDLGYILTVKGRSLESILLRRLALGFPPTIGFFSPLVDSMFYDNIISPVDTNRTINGFTLAEGTSSWSMNPIYKVVEKNETVYDVLVDLCRPRGYGFKIELNEELITIPSIKFIFSFYHGTRRDYTQQDYPFVIFSREFENLVSANSIEDYTNHKSVAYVYGAGDEFTVPVAVIGTDTDLDRKEVYIDGSDIPLDDETGTPIPSGDYLAYLEGKGYEELDKLTPINTLEADIDTDSQYIYGRDFFLGDIVQLEDGRGTEYSARITEIIRSTNEQGTKIYPTFVIE
jgi:hypothetical protein